MNARLALFFPCLTLFSFLVCAENNPTAGIASDGQQVKVGWKAGPTQRGTLMLVYGCLSTIFASTWTVLHLNVPAPDDSAWTRGLRKTKWMAITILFPEFIFSKAVCELRLAVADLYSMHVKLEEAGFRWKSTVEITDTEICKELTWKAEFGPRMRLLYKILGLSRSPKVNKHEQNELQKSSSAERHGSVREAHLSDQRYATENIAPDPEEMKETRSFYNAAEDVEMDSDEIHDYNVEPPDTGNLATNRVPSDQGTGEVRAENSGKVIEGQDMVRTMRSRRKGALAPKQPPVTRYLWPETRTWTLVHSLYANMGGLLYTSAWDVQDGGPVTYPITTQSIVEECDQEATCPLKDLVLEKDDIEDKSKADWLLKAIAISQILWLILNVATRGITKLPVTQLEIATVAFSLMAVATYAVNWWKPKDIVTPTTLGIPTRLFQKANLEGFVKRLLVPSAASSTIYYGNRKRIENDIVWMQGDTPLIWGLMGISSLVFGGLHCLAWNFDFPTDAELVLWRVASLATSALPSFALGVSLLLGFLSTTFTYNKYISPLVSSLAPLEQFPPAWWDLLMQDPEFLDWPPGSWFALRSLDPGTREWDKAPNGLADLPPQAAEITLHDQNWIRHNLRTLRYMRPWIVKAKEGRRDLELYWQLCVHFSDFTDVDDRDIKAAELWDEYEEYLKTKLDPAVPEISAIRYLSFIVNMKATEMDHRARIEKLKRTCDQASRFLTISIGILYTIARLTILVLLFTSLRAAPEEIYKNTAWPRFLPSIS